MSINRRWTALALGALLTTLMLPGGTASADHEAMLDIQVGAPLGELQAEAMRFYPENLTVHRGDTLKFSAGFHTATFIPSSYQEHADWTAEQAGFPGAPYHFLQNNPDHATIPFKLIGDAPFTRRADCGSTDEPCEYDGSSVVDSGLLLRNLEFTSPDPNVPPTDHGFSVTVDAPEGTSFWVVCRLHPNMVMRVTVVEDDADSHSQEEIDAERDASVAQDTADATVLHETLSTQQDSRKIRKGKRVWTAYAGYDTENFTLFEFYPKKLKLKKGDKVAWRFDSLHHEVHTVTHPASIILEDSFESFWCDPNGDDESGDETAPDFQGPFPSCPEGSVLEVGIEGQKLEPTGDKRIVSKDDFANSGIGGSFGPPAYQLTYPKVGAFKFVCWIHPEMVNKVVVKAVR